MHDPFMPKDRFDEISCISVQPFAARRGANNAIEFPLAQGVQIVTIIEGAAP
jgi:hypothetical protein